MKKSISKTIAMTVIASLLFTASVPFCAFAEDKIENANTENEVEIEDVNTTDAEGSIQNAQEEVQDIADTIQEEDLSISTDTLEEIQEDLQEGKKNIEKVDENLENVSDILDNLPTIDNAEDEVQKVEDSIQTFDEEKDKTTEKAEDTITYAGIANTSDDKDEAYAAKDNAVQTLEITEQDLIVAEGAYNVAKDAVAAVDEKYQEALVKKGEIEQQIANAQQELENADTNAQAANQNLIDAQEKMNQLDAEISQLAQSKDDLEAIQNQYYKLLVHYYRDNGVKSAVYNEDGTLDIAGSADKAAENHKNDVINVSENTLKLGRELMKDLIYYKLEANGATNIQFAVQEPGRVIKESADGELTKDANNNDRVIITETQEQYWDYPAKKGGRYHNVKVIYTMKLEDGTEQEVTEYYNYIYKSNKYSDAEGFSDGPIYLAKIDPANEGLERDTDENNMDNYTKLSEQVSKAIEASRVIDKYNEAKAAVDAAQTKVETIKNQINELVNKDYSFNDAQVAALKGELDKAQEELQKATEDKEKLEEKVEEARKAVASISLDRFQTVIEDNNEVIIDIPPVTPETEPVKTNKSSGSSSSSSRTKHTYPIVTNTTQTTEKEEEGAFRVSEAPPKRVLGVLKPRDQAPAVIIEVGEPVVKVIPSEVKEAQLAPAEKKEEKKVTPAEITKPTKPVEPLKIPQKATNSEIKPQVKDNQPTLSMPFDYLFLLLLLLVILIILDYYIHEQEKDKENQG